MSLAVQLKVVSEFGHHEVLKLASNENPLGASPKTLSILTELKNDLHLYPDGNGTKLKKVQIMRTFLLIILL